MIPLYGCDNWLSSTLCDKFNLHNDRSLCPLCLEWFLPLPRPQDCILEDILPTKAGRADNFFNQHQI
jgi:hypothetical protein